MGVVAEIKHIELVEGKYGIMPVIAGTRFKVHDIVGMYVLGTSTIDWIVENFELSPAQIHAALAYYYDHQEQIDQEIADDEALTREVGTPIEDALARMRARAKANNTDK